MSDDSPGKTVHRSTAASISGSHDVPQINDALVAPTTEDEKNTLRAAILPVACFRIEDALFDFDSSVILPPVALEIPHLAALRDQHRDTVSGLFPPLSVFGHADPTGTDAYNKTLSGRRAIALYALLTRRVDLWEQLYSHAQGRDDWKKNAPALMLQGAGLSATPADVKNMQQNAVQRAQVFLIYMDKVAGDFRLAPADFLARGQDARGKGDYQGCSDFNPVLIFSRKDETRFTAATDKTERDTANASNRRVMIFLYRPGSKANPATWPCPRAAEDEGGCRKRFWSDAEKRRHTHLPDDARHYEDAHDTFACRFYDRMATDSPCERLVLVTTLVLRLMDGDDLPFTNARYSLTVSRNAGAQDDVTTDVFTGVTNDNGILQATIPADADRGQLTLFAAGSGADAAAAPTPASKDSSATGNDTTDKNTAGKNAADTSAGIWRFDLVIKPLAAPDTFAGAQARLNNLGLFADTGVNEERVESVAKIAPLPDKPDAELTEEQRKTAQLLRAIQRFQMLYKPHGDKEPAEGSVDAPTKTKLEEKYGS